MAISLFGWTRNEILATFNGRIEGHDARRRFDHRRYEGQQESRAAPNARAKSPCTRLSMRCVPDIQVRCPRPPACSDRVCDSGPALESGAAAGSSDWPRLRTVGCLRASRDTGPHRPYAAVDPQIRRADDGQLRCGLLRRRRFQGVLQRMETMEHLRAFSW